MYGEQEYVFRIGLWGLEDGQMLQAKVQAKVRNPYVKPHITGFIRETEIRKESDIR
jgi:hypothetical protein